MSRYGPGYDDIYLLYILWFVNLVFLKYKFSVTTKRNENIQTPWIVTNKIDKIEPYTHTQVNEVPGSVWIYVNLILDRNPLQYVISCAVSQTFKNGALLP